MIFSSSTFLFSFLGVVLLVYYCLKPFPIFFRNMWLLVSSIYFYAYGERKFVYVMVLSILVNFLCGLYIQKTHKKSIFIFTLIFNVAILFVMKYLNFFLHILSMLCRKYVGAEIPVTNISLPIGISFYTFQEISYIVDVYRGKTEAQKNPFYLGLYISFFPQLIAGPIVRYETVDAQIINRKENWGSFTAGIERFMIGFSKKVLIANNMAVVADEIFSIVYRGSVVSAGAAWIGAISYSLQIFFDFSGYSDMAIGLGKIFGFSFEENFNYPYVSSSVSEFWRRWHISLGAWFRDYVYFPMGGSRVSKGKLFINLFIVWILTGIWHGAYYTFIIWGLMNFTVVVLEKYANHGIQRRKNAAIGRIYTILFVVVGWVVFRADTLGTLKRYLQSLVGFGEGYFNLAHFHVREYLIFYILAFFLSIPFSRCNALKKIDGKMSSLFKNVVECVAFGVAITYVVVNSYNPFIYFNF